MTRYFASFTNIFTDGESASIEVWELSKKAFSVLKADNDETLFDLDYEKATVQFNLRFNSEQDAESIKEILSGVKLIKFGEYPLIASYSFDVDLFTSICQGGDFKVIRLAQTSGNE